MVDDNWTILDIFFDNLVRVQGASDYMVFNYEFYLLNMDFEPLQRLTSI